MRTVYTDKTLAPIYALLPGTKPEAHISIAVRMVEEDRARLKDEGTCVIGAGIAVRYRAPRKRHDTDRILIGAPFQGNVASHKACERALEYLKAQGFDVFWNDGAMD